jgi:hypothetical protein
MAPSAWPHAEIRYWIHSCSRFIHKRQQRFFLVFWSSRNGPGRTTVSGHKKTAAALRLQRLMTGGVDGTRTRDPRRDRPVF